MFTFEKFSQLFTMVRSDFVLDFHVCTNKMMGKLKMLFGCVSQYCQVTLQIRLIYFFLRWISDWKNSHTLWAITTIFEWKKLNKYFFFQDVYISVKVIFIPFHSSKVANWRAVKFKFLCENCEQPEHTKECVKEWKFLSETTFLSHKPF